MKKIILLMCLLMSSAAWAADPWNIGIIAPTTGVLATVGVRQLSAVQRWVRDVNAHGGIRGRTINLISCDDAGNPEKSVTCARNLMGHGIVLLLNASITGPIKAVMPLLQNGPVMVTPSPNVVPPASSYVFQTSPTDLELTEAIASYAKANGADHIAMIAATDATGEVGVKSAAAVFPKAGVSYGLARIDLNSSDASIQLAKVMNNHAAFIYCNYSGGGAATVVKSYSNLGLDVPFLISYANISNAFLKLIHDDMPARLLAVGLKAASPNLVTDPAQRAEIDHFATSYRAWKHEPIDQLSLLGLTMADFATAVLTHVDNPSDAAAVRTYVETHAIPSIAGTMHFSSGSHVGLSSDDVAVLEYKNGHWDKAGPLK